MSIRELSPELAKKAKDELGEVTSRIPEDLQNIKDWLAKQSHINARTDDQWLIAFLRGCKFSLERTKEKLDNYYTMKSLIPEIGVGIDPTEPILQEMISNGTCVPLLKPISKDGPTVMLARPGSLPANKFNVLNIMRITYMYSTIQMLEDDNTTVAGLVVLVDLSNVTVSHIAQLTAPGNMKKFVMTREDAMPLRQKGTHHMHTPPGVETVFSLIKTVISEKNKNRFFVHGDNLEELYKHVPKAILPTEYGGDGGPLQDAIDHWKKKTATYRDWFMDDIQYKTDESKRPGKPKTAEGLFGVEGSFRKLQID